MFFNLVLAVVSVSTGLIWVTGRHRSPRPVVVGVARMVFPCVLLMLLLRGLIAEPYRIPSTSMLPTLHVGDYILVNKLSYAAEDTAPQRGDLVVFRWPVDKHMAFIKRIIGLPGDRVSYIKNRLYINGQRVTMTDLGPYPLPRMEQYHEKFGTLNNNILLHRAVTSYNYYNVVVPKGNYFVMGDNRDDSSDSRKWGFVPSQDILGKAIMIWFSWDKKHYRVRWHRLGRL